MNSNLTEKKLDALFQVKSGNFHSTSELDIGNTPLISCGDANNGLVGYFDIPEELAYQHTLTVAYNGQPLTTKFHPYKFGAKDDVAVLLPRQPMLDTTLLYVASQLNSAMWRYSYGRKCFREKLRSVTIFVPMNGDSVDENAIANLCPPHLQQFWAFIQNASQQLTAD
ncbi:MAG: hypothetical protein M3209_09510 [Acidobacteriota bacterium]|nr:hypothetical protein [Acidobacteriota bacterium]